MHSPAGGPHYHYAAFYSLTMPQSPPPQHEVELDGECRPHSVRGRRSSSWCNGRMTYWLDSVRTPNDGGRPTKQRNPSSFRPLDTFRKPKLRGATTASSIADTLSTEVDSTSSKSSAGRSRREDGSHSSDDTSADRTTSTLFDRVRVDGRMWDVYRSTAASTSHAILFYCPYRAALPMDAPLPFIVAPEDPSTVLVTSSLRISLLRSISSHSNTGVRTYEDRVVQGGDDGNGQLSALVTVEQLTRRDNVLCGSMSITSGWQQCCEALFPVLTRRSKTNPMSAALRSRSVCVEHALAVHVDVVAADSHDTVHVALHTPTIMLAGPSVHTASTTP